MDIIRDIKLSKILEIDMSDEIKYLYSDLYLHLLPLQIYISDNNTYIVDSNHNIIFHVFDNGTLFRHTHFPYNIWSKHGLSKSHSIQITAYIIQELFNIKIIHID